jgi:predicted transcriptional regulator
MTEITVASLKKDIKNRLTELRPLVDEYHRLQEVARALDIQTEEAPRRRQRQTNGRSQPGPRRRAGRSNREVILQYLSANESGTAGQIAQAAGGNRNALATALSTLAKAGVLERAEKGYRLAERGDAQAPSAVPESSETPEAAEAETAGQA